MEITGPDARHLARSLRARPGERISVVEPEGRLLTVRLVTVSANRVEGEIEGEREHHPEPVARITMALALLPAAALEEALTRCTELGADGFVLVQAARSVARAAKPERWASICREAAMLAGRLRVPEVRGPVRIEELGECTFLDREASRHLVSLADPLNLTLAIGPEGGWTEAELELAGGRSASLGPRNLRAENAAAAALTVALAARGDL